MEEGTRSCGIAPAGTLATAGAQFTRFTGTKVQALLVRKYTRSCGIAPAGTLATAGAQFIQFTRVTSTQFSCSTGTNAQIPSFPGLSRQRVLSLLALQVQKYKY